MEGHRRITLYDQMFVVHSNQDSLAGLTLDDVLANQKRAAAPSHHLSSRRTLLDIVRDDESNKKDRRSWKAFKDKLRLKRAGSAWTSSILIPASDIAITIQHNTQRSLSQPQVTPNSSVPLLTSSNSDVSTQHMAHQPDDNETVGSDELAPNMRPQVSRRSSARFPEDLSENPQKFKPSMSRNQSVRMASRAESIRRERVVTFRDSDDSDDEDEGGGGSGSEYVSRVEERQLSAREAVAAQEAAEAAAAAAAQEERSSAEPVTMSLMDLLEETDRQMGFEGSKYRMEDDDDDEECEDDEEEGAEEHNCCVCMVRHRGVAFTPCGHSFCRLCSRELMVSRGNCPLCNNFVLEILEVF